MHDRKRVSGILAAMALLIATLGFLMPTQTEAFGEVDDQRCNGAFPGTPPGSLEKSVATEGGDTLVVPGESVTVTVRWDPAEWDSLHAIADCVQVDGELRDDLSDSEKPPANDGEWKHSYVIPTDLDAGSEVCDRARLSGQPSDDAPREGGKAVDTQKSNIVCLDVVEEQAPGTGDITLTKDATGDAPQGTTFMFDVDCDGEDFDATGITLSDGDTETVVDDAPTGTVCTITETGDGGADSTTFSVDGGDPVAGDSVTVTVGDSITVAVLATNDFEEQAPDTGDVSLTKDATGDVPEGATFVFAVDCAGEDFDATGITLSDGDTKTVVDDAPTGTVCTITETGDGGADTTTFTVDGVDQGETDSVTVTVGDATTVAVIATNDFEESVVTPQTFALNLFKVEEGDPSNLLQGAQFRLFADDGSTSGVLDDGDSFEGVCTTDGDGECDFTGLDAGDYLLVETRAPQGFVAVSDGPVAVTIVDADENITVENAPVTVGGVFLDRPDIDLEKIADPVRARVGETITYTYRITNTGETTLSDITLSDDKLGIILLPDVVLEPGESTEVQATHVVTEADLEAGVIVNVATVTGHPPVGKPVRDEARAEVEVVEVLGVAIDRPRAPGAPAAPEGKPAPEVEARELARTGVYTRWLLTLAVTAMLVGTAFLRAADRREEDLA